MKPRKFTHKEINGWLCPFPIQLTDKKRKWKFDILPLNQVLRWKHPNRLPNVGRVSFNEIARIMEKGYLSGTEGHYIETLAEEWVPVGKGLVIIVKKHETDGIVVYDGSHRLSALARVKRMKKPIKMKYIGVLMPYEK